ncbi:MAG: hypothetical protein MRZ79_21160 [Bacteroidia bacterium]|nr:hypothetical protein [Bacteroidia bacterium]
MQNNWLFKTYMRLPLWGKIAAPLVLVLLVMSLFKMLKVALGLAALGGIAYVVIFAYNKYNAGKDA